MSLRASARQFTVNGVLLSRQFADVLRSIGLLATALVIGLSACTISSKSPPSGPPAATATFLGKWIGLREAALDEELQISEAGSGRAIIKTRSKGLFDAQLIQLDDVVWAAVQDTAQGSGYFDLYQVEVRDEVLTVWPLDRIRVAKDVQSGLLTGRYLSPGAQFDHIESAFITASSNELGQYLRTHPTRRDSNGLKFYRPTVSNRVGLGARKFALLIGWFVWAVLFSNPIVATLTITLLGLLLSTYIRHRARLQG